MWLQREFQLAARSRGFHLVTADVMRQIPEIRELRVGLLQLFIKHTSASLTINENADPEVRGDMERYFNVAVPEKAPWCQHRDEGPDDMPAHIKTSLLGASLSLPISDGRLNLGVWQGIYLCEHRNRGGPRTVVATAFGETAHA